MSASLLPSRVVFAIPVAASCIDAASECFAKWKSLGYSTAALVDGTPKVPENCDITFTVNKYHGYAWAVNCLAQLLDGEFDWLVAGGHDVFPHPCNAATIEVQCVSNFGGTYGVMQPAGDAYGALEPRAAQKACVSPWIGAEFCRKHGPFHAGYFHFWCDAELYEVARQAGALWWREDLTQYHDHHLRTRKPGDPKHPPHLLKAAEAHDADKALFLKRKAAGFPAELVTA